MTTSLSLTTTQQKYVKEVVQSSAYLQTLQHAAQSSAMCTTPHTTTQWSSLRPPTAASPWTWQDAMNWWNASTAAGMLPMQASTCTWDTKQAAEGVPVLTSRVRCLSTCCSTGTGDTPSTSSEEACAYATMSQTPSNESDSQTFCPFTRARARAWAATALLRGAANLDIQCYASDKGCYLGNAPGNTAEGNDPIVCVASSTAYTPGTAESAQAREAAAAFQTVLSWQSYWEQMTCACPTDAHTRGAQTSMCSGNGTCSGKTLVPPALVCSPASGAQPAIASNVYNSGVCTCTPNSGYSGSSCNQLAHNYCSECNNDHTEACNGSTNHMCACSTGWKGMTCDVPVCALNAEHAECNGNGLCMANGICACYDGFSGPQCEVHTYGGSSGANGTSSTTTTSPPVYKPKPTQSSSSSPSSSSSGTTSSPMAQHATTPTAEDVSGILHAIMLLGGVLLCSVVAYFAVYAWTRRGYSVHADGHAIADALRPMVNGSIQH